MALLTARDFFSHSAGLRKTVWAVYLCVLPLLFIRPFLAVLLQFPTSPPQVSFKNNIAFVSCLFEAEPKD